MAFWLAGLATRVGAQRASRWGGIACLLQATRMTIGNVASVIVADKPLDNAIVWLIGASLVPILYVVAGIRLWKGEGLVWGGLAGLAFLLDLVLFGPKPISIEAAAALIVRAALFILMVNGVRGALALRTVDYSEEERRVFN